MKKGYLFFIGAFLLLSPVHALEVKESNQIILEVRGVVCSFCAFGLSKNLSKLEFVNSDLFEKGVYTDIKKGHVTLAINPDDKINFREINKRVKKGGYELRGIHILLKGPTLKSDGIILIENKKNGQKFELMQSDGTPFTQYDRESSVVIIQGYIPQEQLKNTKSKRLIGVRVKDSKEMKQQAPELKTIDTEKRQHRH